MAGMRRKTDLPTKLCVVCSRPCVWRKKWARDWANVKYCSKRCRALNLNVHFHMLFLDGVYVEHPGGSLRFRWVMAPTFGIIIVLRSINANPYSLIDIIVSPAAAAFLGYLIFNEVPAPSMLYGGALLLGAGAWLTSEMSADEPDHSKPADH